MTCPSCGYEEASGAICQKCKAPLISKLSDDNPETEKVEVLEENKPQETVTVATASVVEQKTNEVIPTASQLSQQVPVQQPNNTVPQQVTMIAQTVPIPQNVQQQQQMVAQAPPVQQYVVQSGVPQQSSVTTQYIATPVAQPIQSIPAMPVAPQQQTISNFPAEAVNNQNNQSSDHTNATIELPKSDEKGNSSTTENQKGVPVIPTDFHFTDEKEIEEEEEIKPHSADDEIKQIKLKAPKRKNYKRMRRSVTTATILSFSFALIFDACL